MRRKVALVGNMNNNHFAFLRYLRDIGWNAHLLLYKNEQNHFHPKFDTWNYEKWKPYIVQTDLMNGITKRDISLLFYSKRKIKKLFEEFDYIIANGAMPIYAYRANLTIDVFLPYGVGIEFLSIRNENLFRRISSTLIRKLQLRGLNSFVRHIVTLDFSKENLKNFKYLSKSPKFLGIPMVYNLEKPQNTDVEHLNSVIAKMREFDFVLFSHVSHIWEKIPSNWKFGYKQNDILIKAFALFLKNTPPAKANSVLILLEYGSDVDASKSLINSLGISENVVWLQTMSRKEIMYLLDFVDLGCGELGGLIWGGTGWEFLAKGVPFFQYVDIDEKEYFKITNQPFPKIINTNSIEEIADYLTNFESNKSKHQALSNDLKDWFNKFAGIELARRYEDLLLKK